MGRAYSPFIKKGDAMRHYTFEKSTLCVTLLLAALVALASAL